MIIQEGKNLRANSFVTGRQHPVLQKAAEEHAAFQARVMVQGHQLWSMRVLKLRGMMPECSEFSEVCADSWPYQDAEDAVREIYRLWKQSPRHWDRVNGACTYWGYAMAQGENGVWYACGIMAKVK